MDKINDPFLTKLTKIKEVNAPDHIKENVFNRIKNIQNETLSFKWKVVFYAAASIVIALNLFTIKNKISNSKKTEIQLVNQSTISNHLYYE